MTLSELKVLIEERFGSGTVTPAGLPPEQNFLILYKEKFLEVFEFLHTSEKTYFDFLSSINGVDNGPVAGTMDVIYNLYSIPFNHHLMVKVELRRNLEGEEIPTIPSVSGIWKTANWLERETFDLMGIHFTNHPDLRRILLPADWKGYPLRKDYTLPDYYHGIKVEY